MMEIEIWLMIDEDGCYGVGRNRGAAVERYTEDETTDIIDVDGLRTYRLLVTVPLPKMVEIRGAIEAHSGAPFALTAVPEAV